MTTRRCYKCGGMMILSHEEDGDEWACINCGERRSLKQMEEIMKQDKTKDTPPTPEQLRAAVDKLDDELEPDYPHIPPKPDISGKTKFQYHQALHKYYKENSQEIIEDFYNKGRRYILKRWGMSSCGLDNFRKRHNLPGVIENRDNILKKSWVKEAKPWVKKPEPGPEPETERQTTISIYILPELANLPDFPEFDPKWKKEVQVAWLSAYHGIYTRAK